MGQVSDKSNRIRQNDFAHVINFEASQRRIKRCKQLVCSIDLSLRQRIEQCRFTRIGVSDNSNGRYIRALTRTATLVTLCPYFLKTGMNTFYPLPQKTSVSLKLSFTRPAHADTTFLTFKVSPATDQSGRLMLQLCQLNL